MSNDNRASCGCPTYWVEDKGKPYGDCPYCEIDRMEKEIKELREDSKDCIACAKESAERVDELEKKLEAEIKAADHWCQQSCEDHNKAVKMETKLDKAIDALEKIKSNDNNLSALQRNPTIAEQALEELT